MGTDAGQLGLDFGPAFTARPLLRVTPARLAVWDRCPRRYRMTYVDRPTPPRGGARAGQTLGAVVHLALRSLFDLPPAQRTPRAAAALVDRNWSAEGFRDREQAGIYRLAARGWVADYAAALDPDIRPVGVERWVSAAVGGIVAQGRVDRIDERDGELVIVDYKTGRHVLDVADARDSQALALYAAAAARALHRPCSRVELHHLPSGRVLAWEHDDESLQAHLDAAQRGADAAQDAADALADGGDPDALYPAVTSPGCAACDMRRHCPQGRAAAPAQTPWESLGPIDVALVAPGRAG